MQTELFAIVEGFDGYLVSNCGRVVSLKTGRELAWQIMPNGYAVVGLHKNNQGSRALVHRLVAEAFIDNPDGLPEVNHKDGDKLNNSETFIESVDDEYDCTYRDHYFKAVEDDEHRAMVAEALEERGE